MEVGQIFYRVLDNRSGKYISTGDETGDNPNGRIKIYQDIIAQYPGASRLTKVGIQAPPGTRVVINDKTIMIGRTGVYELDQDIAITSLRFERTYNYIRKPDKSNELLNNGMVGMAAAKMQIETDMKEFAAAHPGEPPISVDTEGYDTYWADYENKQTDFWTAYSAALDTYNSGVIGVYELPNPTNLDADENYKDLYNIIVDFLYE